MGGGERERVKEKGGREGGNLSSNYWESGRDGERVEKMERGLEGRRGEGREKKGRGGEERRKESREEGGKGERKRWRETICLSITEKLENFNC